MLAIQNFIAAVHDPLAASWPAEVCQTNPQQFNGKDCGLAVCLNLRVIASQPDILNPGSPRFE